MSVGFKQRKTGRSSRIAIHLIESKEARFSTAPREAGRPSTPPLFGTLFLSRASQLWSIQPPLTSFPAESELGSYCAQDTPLWESDQRKPYQTTALWHLEPPHSPHHVSSVQSSPSRPRFQAAFGRIRRAEPRRARPAIWLLGNSHFQFKDSVNKLLEPVEEVHY